MIFNRTRPNIHDSKLTSGTTFNTYEATYVDTDLNNTTGQILRTEDMLLNKCFPMY